ncbi:hypothetical protein AVEN_218255-1 [Araneus ventricosus]|uniref:Uncharacterized protein n=1 Tax=Araneus ventricosus TaxID=182803 RepID=A0A4Y2RTH6_ARAVE|nr:hypothetical protein AVEN_218255-1 [Araneus ventricosus]
MVGESSSTLYIEDCRQRIEIGRFRNVLKLFVDEEALFSQAFSAITFFESWTGMGPQWPSSKVKASRPEGSRFETQSHRISGVYVGLLQAKSYVRGQMSSRQCDAEV